MIDLGSGALQRLAEAGGSYQNLEAVLLSHNHPDHFASLLPLLQALNYTPGFVRRKPLYLYAPEETVSLLEVILEETPAMQPRFPMEVVVLSEKGELLTDFGKLAFCRLAHSGQTTGFRFETGAHTLVYGADTGPCAELVELANAADVAIFECSFTSEVASDSHLNLHEAGRLAKIAQVRRLLLSHFYPEVASLPESEKEAQIRKSGFDGEIVFCKDLTRIVLASEGEPDPYP
jgi:ribonuclease BN (tRNA processing enzyme)